MVAPAVTIPPSEEMPPLVFVPDDVLPAMVASVRTTVPWLKMPPPSGVRPDTELSEIVVSVIVRVPLFQMPPPWAVPTIAETVLSVMLESVMVALPSLTTPLPVAPELLAASLPVIVESVMLTVPSFTIPPPDGVIPGPDGGGAAPPVSVRASSVTSAPAATTKTELLRPVASTTAVAWPGHCSMVTVFETATTSLMVPATSTVPTPWGRERAWEMVAQGAVAIHALRLLPVADTNRASPTVRVKFCVAAGAKPLAAEMVKVKVP